MGRMIWKVLAVLLAVWLAFMVIGGFLAMLKTFFIIGSVAVVAVLLVSLVAKRRR